MEWAIFIPPSGAGPALSATLDQSADSPLEAAPAGESTKRSYAGLPGAPGRGSAFERVYWGTEFCEILLPGAKATERLAAEVRERGLAWTLVTPYLTEGGLERLRRLLDRLPVEAQPDEVVVNDWGTLRWLGRSGHRIRPVLGRLMNKMIRDPRVAQHYDQPGAPSMALDAVRNFSVSTTSYRSFLEAEDVTRLEVDNLLQGMDVDFAALGLRASLYLPFGYVTTGRICLPGSLAVPEARKFAVIAACGHECRRVVLKLKNTRSPFEADRGLTLFQRGNTVFFSQTPDQAARGLDAARRGGVDRVVWQRELPF